MKLPTSEAAKRVAAICHRKLTTPWSDREIKCFRKLVKSGCFKDLSDLATMERYCAFQRSKGDRGLHRRDPYTLIYNWSGELDRANSWAERNPVIRKVIPLPPVKTKPFQPPTDPEELAAIQRFEAFRKAKKEMGR